MLIPTEYVSQNFLFTSYEVTIVPDNRLVDTAGLESVCPNHVAAGI